MLAVFGWLAAPCSAQTEQGAHAAYFEFGGSGIFYSINGEVPIARNRTVRVGGMILPSVIAAAAASVNQLFGGGGNYLVIGVGATLGRGHDASLKLGTATVGYRYMVPGGAFFQFALTPFFSTRGVHPYAGISIGKSY
jgi:hypothetical protein